MNSLDASKIKSREGKETPRKSSISLEDRIATHEHKELYDHLVQEAEEMRQELYRILPDSTGPSDEPLPQIIVNRLLNEVALYAREFGVHYDNYKVGAVLVGVRTPTPSDPNPWVIFFDANTKPTSRDTKHCAEQYLMDRAERAAQAGTLKTIQAFLVAAPRRDIPDDIGFKDDVSKKKQITLTPCAVCRERMTSLAQGKHPLISAEKTEVITANSDTKDLWVRKFQKVADLAPFHGEPLPKDVMEIDEND